MKFIKELISRWKSQVPDFWKKVRAFGLWLLGIGTAVLAANVSVGLNLDGWQLEAAKDLVLVGTVLSSAAQFTKIDSDATA